MSVLKSTIEAPAIAVPLKVRLEPYLVESICELSRLVRDKGNQHNDIGGLLLGRSEAGLRTVEAIKTFAEGGPHSDLARRERQGRAYKTALDEVKIDPELSAFEVVGWFSFRNGSGLLSSDVTFHNHHFRKAEDLALIVWREALSQITIEVYAKSDSDTMTSDDYRWGSVRLSSDIRHMRDAVELAMRPKLNDDSYLNAYDTEPETQFGHLMRRAELATDKFFGLFSRQKEEGEGERVRALIGDGRLPSRAAWPPEATESLPNPQTYFNPYSDSLRGMRSQAAASGAASFPAAAGAAPAPARTSELRGPLALPPVPVLDLGRLGQMPRSRRAQPEVGGLPMVIRPPKKPFPWPMAAALFVVCSAAVFAFLSLGGLQSDGGRVGQAFHAMFPGGELNLRVHNEDDRLRLTWNQRNHAVASATDGILQIFDGQQHREVHLEGRQVADGSVLYRPLTNDVTFRLEVRGEQGGASGSIRLLDGLSSQQPVLDVSAPRASSASPSGTASNGAANSTSANTATANMATPGLLADANAIRDPNAPTLLRPSPETFDSTPDPIAQAPVKQAPSGGSPKPVRPARYETPLNIGTFPGTGSGSTINGWDAASRLRYKQRNQRATKPAVAPANFSGAGFVAPRPLMQVMPRTSSIPAGTIQNRTRVQVQVTVDPSGKVAAARVVGPGVNETIASAALAAARQWTFEPASNNGQRVASDHTIVFEFRPEK